MRTDTRDRPVRHRRRNGRVLLAACIPLALLLLACAASPGSGAGEANQTMEAAMTDKPSFGGKTEPEAPPQIAAKRAAPPRVAPVTFEGTTYRQIRGGEADLQGSGVLAAEDAAGNRKWTIAVYDVPYDPVLERDVQEVYFTSMELDAENRALIIENERGERYSVGIDVAKVTRLP